jgi:chromosome segregation ATPase
MTYEEKAEHKIKQLSEAIQLLEDVGGRLDWATDFAAFNSIVDALSPINSLVYDTQTEFEEELEQLEEELKAYKEDKERVDEDFDCSSTLKYWVG